MQKIAKAKNTIFYHCLRFLLAKSLFDFIKRNAFSEKDSPTCVYVSLVNWFLSVLAYLLATPEAPANQVQLYGKMSINDENHHQHQRLVDQFGCCQCLCVPLSPCSLW